MDQAQSQCASDKVDISIKTVRYLMIKKQFGRRSAAEMNISGSGKRLFPYDRISVDSFSRKIASTQR